MRRALRAVAAVALLLLLAGAIFLVPTLWLRPWSIDHFFARVFLEFALARPMLLSQLRILEPWGLDFHSDELDDFSVEFAWEQARAARQNLEMLRSWDRDPLSPEQRFSADVLDWFLATVVEGERFLFHDYPLNQLDGVQSALPDFMVNVHQVHGERDARDYVARLERFGVALDQVIEGVRERARRGVVPPRFVVAHVRREVADFVALPPEANVLGVEFEKKLAGVADLAEAKRAELVAVARRAIADVVYPAYRRVGDYLPELEASASEDAGVWRLPDGDAYYAWTLRSHTTTALSPDEIHALGLAEVERIRSEMRAILAGNGGTGDLAADLTKLDRDERFLYPDTEEGRAEILADYRAIIQEVAPRLPELFGRLPRARVEVEPVPAFREEGAAGAYYWPAPFDGSKPATFFVNLRDVADVRRWAMRTLAFHEAIPGHHLQIALSFELEGVPFFRRVVPFSAFSEGWALYAERLAGEQGFHPTPFDRVGQLQAELFRAVRLVVDTGLHAKRWTREAAIDYMLRHTGMPESDVVPEVERYIVDPGQACAYKIGQLEILRLRERARVALGSSFDLREFHDVVLGGGSLPMELLERVVKEWVSRKRDARAASADEDHLARRAAPFQRLVRRSRLGEGEAGADAHAQAALRDGSEHRARAELELLARGGVVRERGAGHEERAERAQAPEVEGRHDPARLPEQREQAARPERCEAPLEGVAAHRVVDHVDAASARRLARDPREVFVAVENDAVGARLAHERGLLGRGAGSDHDGAGLLQRLHEEQTRAARGGVDEGCVARARRAHPVREVVRRHALEHRCGRGLVGDALGHAHERRDGRDDRLRVRARHRGPGDAIAGAESRHACAHLLD